MFAVFERKIGRHQGPFPPTYTTYFIQCHVWNVLLYICAMVLYRSIVYFPTYIIESFAPVRQRAHYAYILVQTANNKSQYYLLFIRVRRNACGAPGRVTAPMCSPAAVLFTSCYVETGENNNTKRTAHARRRIRIYISVVCFYRTLFVWIFECVQTHGLVGFSEQ